MLSFKIDFGIISKIKDSKHLKGAYGIVKISSFVLIGIYISIIGQILIDRSFSTLFLVLGIGITSRTACTVFGSSFINSIYGANSITRKTKDGMV